MARTTTPTSARHPAAGIREPGPVTSRPLGAQSVAEIVVGLSLKLSLSSPGQGVREVRAALRGVQSIFGLDHCAFYRVRRQSGRMEQMYAASRLGLRKLPRLLDARGLFPWLFSQTVQQGRVVHVGSVDRLPPSASTDRSNYTIWGPGCLLVIPADIPRDACYQLILVSPHRPLRWSAAKIRQLQVLAAGLAGAMCRDRIESERLDALRFERLLCGSMGPVADDAHEEVDQRITLALNEVQSLTNVDHVGLFCVNPGSREAYVSHAAHSTGIGKPAGATPDYAAACPWLYQTIVSGNRAYSFSRPDELPPEANADRLFLRAHGIRSGLLIPLATHGCVQHVLALATKRREHAWPTRLVERLRGLSQVCGIALQGKHAADATHSAMRRLADLQRIAGVGIWEYDAANGRVELSAQSVATLGKPIESLADWQTLILPEDRGRARAAFEAALLDPATEHRLEYRIASPVGTVRDIEQQVRTAYPSSGGAARLQGTLKDITESKRCKQELDELRRQQRHADRIAQTGVLLASLAHELSQPLTAIRSNAQAALRFLAAEALDPSEAKDILSDIIADNKRATEIISTLRRAMQRQDAERELVDVGDIVLEVFRLLHTEFVDHGVQTTAECQPGSYAIVSRTQIQQVAVNLIVNAVEAMQTVTASRRNLQVTVARAEAGSLRMIVRDSGVGMAQADLNRAFDAFWTTKPSGTGMGLPVCKTIVELHGGRIWAEPNDGPGCAFFVLLPAAAPPGAVDAAGDR